MFFILGILIAAAVFCFIKHNNSVDGDGWEIFGTFFVGGIIVAIIAIVNFYQSEKDFKQVVASRQETINEIIGDKEDYASNREKAELVEVIVETNDRITELQLDNKSWFWAFGTPDIVDTIKPLKMVCTCPGKK
jgi:hypothetical protein